MTCINTYILHDRVCIVSDAAHYDQDGQITEFAPKVHTIASFNGVVTGLGLLAGSILATQIAEQFGSFDEFITSSAPHIEREFTEFLTTTLMLSGTELRQDVSSIIVAGWSEWHDRPQAFRMSTAAKVAGDGEAVFVWIEMQPGSWEHQPGLSMAQMWDLHRAGMEPEADWNAETFDPRIHGLAVMQSQRRSRTSPKFWSGEPFHCIGGFCQLTEVRREGITQTVLHEWPDEVGEPIQAEPVPNDLPMIPPSFVTTRQSEWLKLYRAGMIDPVTLLPKAQTKRAPQPAAAASLDGLSRLQRERMLKKAKKGTLRAV